MGIRFKYFFVEGGRERGREGGTGRISCNT